MNWFTGVFTGMVVHADFQLVNRFTAVCSCEPGPLLGNSDVIKIRFPVRSRDQQSHRTVGELVMRHMRARMTQIRENIPDSRKWNFRVGEV